MQFSVAKFKNMPYSAKMGFTLWVAGWAWLMAVYYYLTKDSDWTLKLFIAIGLLTIFISQAQNWARLIGILANIMGILLSTYFYLGGFVMVATVNVVLFGGGIYYLMVPATTGYFKEQSKPASAADGK
jgi:hypothetical protein